MGHLRHAMGHRGGEIPWSAEPERKVEPPVSHPEQDGGRQPIHLAEPGTLVVAEVCAVPAQEEQRHGVRQGSIVPFEELAGRGIHEAGQGFDFLH